MNDSDGVSLKEFILKIQEYWRFLLSKWKIIIIAGLIGAIAGIIYSVQKKEVYTAELSFALQDEKSGGGIGVASGLASQFGIDVGGGGGQFFGDNLLELIKSRYIVEKALLYPVNIKSKKTTLAEYYIDFNSLREKWKDKPMVNNIHYLSGTDRTKFTLKQDSVLGSFYKELIKNSLVVDKIDKKLSIYSIKVNSTNELFSKTFAETLANVVSEFYIQTKTEKASRSVSVLKHQADSVRTILNASIYGVASSLDASPNPNPALLSLRVPSQKKTVDVQINTTILNELYKNLEYSKMTLLQETPLIQLIDRPILPLDKNKPGLMKSSLIGAILFSFLTALILTCKLIYNKVLN
ncbi:MAG: lipopolysaccharide biosynthesis protein [Pedobacter sp.]|nr:MAG: lipopolysaccharide biosynthesis protein [Pedobacter sp.]